MSTIENITGVSNIAWAEFAHGAAHRCRIFIVPEEEGGYSVFAADLPGAASQGESIDEAKNNIEDVLTEMIRYHRGRNEDIPWDDAGIQKSADTIEKWVTVNA